MKLRNKLALIITILLIPTLVYGGATFSRSKTWSAGETLTAAQLNTEFNNILNNLTPAGIDDESSSNATAQATSDPYPSSVLSKATSLQTEIQQIRYLLAQITGNTYWYQDPATSLTAASQSVFTTAITLTSGQIAFPATAVPSADANTLDDYEEGTWTPVVAFGGASVDVTYGGGNGGRYTKVGRMVHLNGYLVLTANGSSSGTAFITGLPFTCVNDSGGYAPPSFRPSVVSYADMFIGRVEINTTTIRLEEVTNAGTVTQLTNADFAATSNIMINVSYEMQ